MVNFPGHPELCSPFQALRGGDQGKLMKPYETKGGSGIGRDGGFSVAPDSRSTLCFIRFYKLSLIERFCVSYLGHPDLRIPSFSIGFIRVGACRSSFRILNSVTFSLHPLLHKVS